MPKRSPPEVSCNYLYYHVYGEEEMRNHESMWTKENIEVY